MVTYDHMMMRRVMGLGTADASPTNRIPVTSQGMKTLKFATFNFRVATNANIVGTALTPTVSPCFFDIHASYYRAGRLEVIRRRVGVGTLYERLNAGANLATSSAYRWRIGVSAGDRIGIRYSVGATAMVVKVFEVD